MVPNVTHGKGFHGLLLYLLVDKDTGLPRRQAHLIGGTLTGQSVGELSAEFGLIRRLRPHAEKVVMHHSLSYGPDENPTDEQIRRDVDCYLQHMGLAEHPHVLVAHRDKGCVHVHIPISKIGAHGEWFDARLDHPHSQIAAGLVEREFGLVEVLRPHKQKYVDEAWEKMCQKRPELRKAKPSPHLADMSEEGVAAEIARRLKGIPAGLTLPEWVEAAEVEGVQLQPNLGGDKISGWKCQLRGTDTTPIKLSKTNISWKKDLLDTGAVHYDPAQHLATARQLLEVPFASPSSEAPVQPLPENHYPRDIHTCRWDWEPEKPVPGLVEHGLVDRQVEPGLRPGTNKPGIGKPVVREVRRPQEAVAPRPPVGPDWFSQPHLAPAVPAALGDLPGVAGEGRDPCPAGPGLHVGRRVPVRRPGAWAGPSADFAPTGPGPHAGGHDHCPEAPGPRAQRELRGEPVGRLSPEPGRGRDGRPGGSSVGLRLDRRSLAGLIGETVRKVVEPLKEAMHKLAAAAKAVVQPEGYTFRRPSAAERLLARRLHEREGIEAATTEEAAVEGPGVSQEPPRPAEPESPEAPRKRRGPLPPRPQDRKPWQKR